MLGSIHTIAFFFCQEFWYLRRKKITVCKNTRNLTEPLKKQKRGLSRFFRDLYKRSLYSFHSSVIRVMKLV